MKTDTDLFQIHQLAFDSFGADKAVQEKSGGDEFGTFFDAAMGLYNETNIYQLEAEQLQIDYVTGKTDDIIALNMAQNKATSALQFTTQVTNKVLSAYQEIMRMQM